MKAPQRIARKYVNVMDHVREVRPMTPPVAVIQRVPDDVDLALIPPPMSAFALEWSDLRMSDLVGLSRRGDCE
jgi:hypothetical protein